MSLLRNTLSDIESHANKKVAGSLLADKDHLFELAKKNQPFPSELETTYNKYRNYQFLKDNHKLILFGVFIYASFLPTDIILYHNISTYPFFSRTLLVLFIISFYLTSLKKSIVSNLPTISMLLVALGGLQAFIGATILPDPHDHLFVVGVIMFLVFGICLLRFCFKRLAALIAINISFYIVYLFLLSNIDCSVLSINVFYQDYRTLMFILLIVISMVGLYTAWLVEKLHRKQWLQKQIAKNETIKQSKLLKQLNQQSITDGLSQIYNRRYFDEEFSRLWDWHVLRKQSLSIIMLDLDWFKLYNDNYGHQRGDDCLIEIATLLKKAINKENSQRAHLPAAKAFVARYGGEEFIIFLPKTSIGEAQAFSQKLCETIYNEQIEHQYSPLGVCSVSIGIASVDKPTDYYKELDMTQLLKLADDASYQAKKRGKNCVVLMTELPDV